MKMRMTCHTITYNAIISLIYKNIHQLVVIYEGATNLGKASHMDQYVMGYSMKSMIICVNLDKAQATVIDKI